MRKGLWSPDEDERLVRCITKYVNGSWSDIARKAGLDRCGKSCRRRWMNHLRPDLKRGKFSMDEINLIVQLQESLGNRWSDIASQLDGRTDNDVKNLWNTQIKKRLSQLKSQNGISDSSTLSDIKPLLASNSNNTNGNPMEFLQAINNNPSALSFGNINYMDACSGSSCDGGSDLSDHNSAAWNSGNMPDIKSHIDPINLWGSMHDELYTNLAQISGKNAVDSFAPQLKSCNISLFPFQAAAPPPPPPITTTATAPYCRVIEFQGSYGSATVASVESSSMPGRALEVQCHAARTHSNNLIDENEECSSEQQRIIDPPLINPLINGENPNHLLSSIITNGENPKHLLSSIITTSDQTNAHCSTEALQQQYYCNSIINISADLDHINVAGSSNAPPITTTSNSTMWGGADQLESMQIGWDLADCSTPHLTLPDWCKFLQSDLL